MNNYKILKEGKDDKVLVEWERANIYPYYGKEYSIHTRISEDSLIWGHYFLRFEDADRYFKKVTK